MVYAHTDQEIQCNSTKGIKEIVLPHVRFVDVALASEYINNDPNNLKYYLLEELMVHSENT